MNEIVERYLGTWNETDAGKRRALINALYAEQASYVDPMAEAYGRDAIDATIAAVQTQFPGFVFTLAGPVDAHHRQVRFTWGLGPKAPSRSWWDSTSLSATGTGASAASSGFSTGSRPDERRPGTSVLTARRRLGSARRPGHP